MKLAEHAPFIKFVIFWIVLPLMALLWGWLLLHFYPRLAEFTWGVFCDAQGKPAYGRLASWVALNAALLWDTHIVWKTEKIPDLWGQLIFIGGLFAIEKLPEVAAILKGVQLPQANLPTSAPSSPNQGS